MKKLDSRLHEEVVDEDSIEINVGIVAAPVCAMFNIHDGRVPSADEDLEV